MIRKVLFWTHLSMGVAAGLVIALMAVTGVLLTYELQLVAWADRDYRVVAPTDARALPLEELLEAGEAAGFGSELLRLQRDPNAPVLIQAGRRDPGVYLNPYSGVVLGAPSATARKLVSSVRGLHRWLLFEGDQRTAARLVTGVSNLLFLLLIVSGLYLWLPKLWRWPILKPRLLFSGPYRDLRSRDFHWHHVLGIWTALPLLVITATALVFSFSWANTLVYAAFGESPPVRGAASSDTEPRAKADGETAVPLAALVSKATADVPEWQRVVVHVPKVDSAEVSIDVDSGNGRQPHRVTKRYLSRVTGTVVREEPFQARSPGRKARSWIRFLHTGEALGWVGQTIAGLTSALALVMVWTGLALAWRRLIRPLLTGRASAGQAPSR